MPICDGIYNTQCLLLNSFIFLKPSSLCSFCDLYDELPIQILYECGRIKFSLPELVQCL